MEKCLCLDLIGSCNSYEAGVMSKHLADMQPGQTVEMKGYVNVRVFVYIVI